MPYHLRLLHSTDAAAYQQLRLRSYQEAPYAFSESYKDEVKRQISFFENELKQEGTPPTQYVLGAFNELKQLIGFVKFRRDRRSKALHKAMVHAMYVQADYRNQQIGGALLQEVIDRARKMTGLEQIHLWVLHSDRTASHFYQRYGFVSQGIIKQDLKIEDRYVDAEYMVLYF